MDKTEVKKAFATMSLKSQGKLLGELEDEHAKAGGRKHSVDAGGSARALPRPFVKWAGGKHRMLPHILEILTASPIRTYVEPFVGGGATFFELSRRKAFKKAILSDANPELIGCYIAIRDQVEDVLEELKDDRYRYGKDEYAAMRKSNPLGHIEKATRFLYLNKTCFNGLYRVNSKGGFNVPFGKYENPVIRDEALLRAAGAALKGAEVYCADFATTAALAKRGDAMYMDPPYVPSSDTSKFTSYTADGFTIGDHRRLADRFGRSLKAGVNCVLSNSHTDLALELYGVHRVQVFEGARSIGGPAGYRGRVKEILVSRKAE